MHRNPRRKQASTYRQPYVSHLLRIVGFLEGTFVIAWQFFVVVIERVRIYVLIDSVSKRGGSEYV